MKHLKTYLTVALVICSMTICNGQKTLKNIIDDFNSLIGSWEGSLTYLDYKSGEPYTMPANIEINRLGETNKFSFSHIYPKEQNANSVDTVSISDDTKFIDKELLKSRKKKLNGDIEIITEEKGNDGNDNKSATIRYTYIIGKTTYTKRKDVQFEGETKWIKRHEYSYTRKSGR